MKRTAQNRAQYEHNPSLRAAFDDRPSPPRQRQSAVGRRIRDKPRKAQTLEKCTAR